MKNADMPAMPMFNEHGAPIHHSSAGIHDGCLSGLTKREEFAARFMAAHLTTEKSLGFSSDEIAKWAIEDADALLKALEESK